MPSSLLRFLSVALQCFAKAMPNSVCAGSIHSTRHSIPTCSAGQLTADLCAYAQQWNERGFALQLLAAMTKALSRRLSTELGQPSPLGQKQRPATHTAAAACRAIMDKYLAGIEPQRPVPVLQLATVPLQGSQPQRG